MKNGPSNVAISALSAIIGVAALTTSLQAEFVTGNLAYIQGVAGPETGYTYWGSNVNGQFHALGTSNQQFADQTLTNNYVSVSSTVLSPTSMTFLFDFSNYSPGSYTLHAFEIDGLKTDFSILSVTASQGYAFTPDGNKIRWDGLGADLAINGLVSLTLTQAVPAPGAMALIGLAGFAGTRRRRA